MKPADRQKVCSNCDGRIPLNAKECIYCGAELPEVPAQTNMFKQQTLQESLTSLYSPPYSAKRENLFEAEQEAPRKAPPPQPQVAAAAMQEEETEEDVKSSFLPLFLLVVGTNLFTIGLLQLFFSTNGLLRLEWDSTYWFFYCLVAAPMCYFGYKQSTK